VELSRQPEPCRSSDQSLVHNQFISPLAKLELDPVHALAHKVDAQPTHLQRLNVRGRAGRKDDIGIKGFALVPQSDNEIPRPLYNSSATGYFNLVIAFAPVRVFHYIGAGLIHRQFHVEQRLLIQASQPGRAQNELLDIRNAGKPGRSNEPLFVQFEPRTAKKSRGGPGATPTSSHRRSETPDRTHLVGKYLEDLIQSG
jgi:hypothetical protein